MKIWELNRKNLLIIHVFVAVLAFALVGMLRHFELLLNAELYVYDKLLNLQEFDDPDESQVVVIGLNEADIRALVQYPISDHKMAELLENLCELGAACVGVDIFRDIEVPEVDNPGGRKRLAKVIDENDHVYFIMKLDQDLSEEPYFGVDPPPEAFERDQIGFNDLLPDAGQILRRGLLIFGDESSEVSFFSLSLQLAGRYLGDRGFEMGQDAETGTISLGGTPLTIFDSNFGAYIREPDAGYQIQLDFKGPIRHNRFSVMDVINGKVSQADIKDKIVLIGVTAESIQDLSYLPVVGTNPDRPYERFGVEAHAAIVDQLVRAATKGEGPLRSWSELGEYVFIGICCWLGALLGIWKGTVPKLLFALLLGTVVIGVIAWMVFSNGVWIPVVAGVCGWGMGTSGLAGYILARERIERRQLLQLFSRYVSKDVLPAIWEQRDKILGSGALISQEMMATVVFTDLVGFSSVSEKMSPQELMVWLNQYMEEMSNTVTDNDGCLDKYIGDAIMAVFGIPIPRVEKEDQALDAKHAVLCALDMRDKIAVLNERWLRLGLPTIQMRVGVQTGMLVAGNLGSSQRMEYTIIGDTVNTAARLESFDKALMDEDIAANGCRILIGDETYELVKDDFETRFIGKMPVKGKEVKVGIHGVLGRRDESR